MYINSVCIFIFFFVYYLIVVVYVIILGNNDEYCIGNCLFEMFKYDYSFYYFCIIFVYIYKFYSVCYL